jgi:hypothetical protein
MKKALRAVALAQNGIEPSTANINANIKTKLPRFEDDGNDDDELRETAKRRGEANIEPIRVPPLPLPRPLQPSFAPTPNTNRTRTEQSPSHGKSAAERRFEEFWQTLSTEDGVKISGSEVKGLFGHSDDRRELSKLWRLCNRTYKGHLSKGELFAFLTLMKGKGGLAPTALSP